MTQNTNTFKVGDFVTCVDTTDSRVLKLGETYLVVSQCNDLDPRTINLVHVATQEQVKGYYASRFKLASTTPNYNDGLIHGWNGGDCPVHPETVVAVVMNGVGGWGEDLAGGFRWSHKGGNYSDILAFKVVKEYKEPQVVWVYSDDVQYSEPKDKRYKKFIEVVETNNA